jgi:hypothetical protein
MKSRKQKAPKKIKGIHNLDLIDDTVYHRTKKNLKKMKFDDEGKE